MKKWLGSIIVLAAFIFFLSKVFSGNIVLPQSVTIAGVAIHYYGIVIALAAVAGCYWAVKRTKKYGIDSKQAEDILFWVIVCGFIGARLYHVLSSFGYYSHHPADIIKIWNGGLSIYGAILGGALGLVLVSRIFNPSTGSGQVLKSSILNLFDWLAPAVLLGQIIGRLGNLFNYELFGYPTKLIWGMFVPEGFRPRGFLTSASFHPIFLYEMAWNVVVLGIILYTEKAAKMRSGAVFFFYLLLYNLGRFFLEFLRIDSVFYHGIRVNALVSLALVTVSIVWIFYNKRNVFLP